MLYEDMSNEELLIVALHRLPGITEVSDSNRNTILALLTVFEDRAQPTDPGSLCLPYPVRIHQGR